MTAGMRASLLYAALIAVALLVLAIFPIDHDPGPARGEHYPHWDRWSKWHLIGSAILAAAAMLILRVPFAPAIALTIVAGIGWEIVNGYIDRWDITWDAVGAIAGAIAALLVRLL